MSKFQNKVAQLKQTLCPKTSQNCNHNRECHTVLAFQPVQCHSETRKDVQMQQPIIIQKKVKHQESKNISESKTISVSKKKLNDKKLCVVQPFVPVKLSHREKKRTYFESTQENIAPTNKEIEIHIQKEDKQCLKKLFKKIHKLTDQLAKSDKQKLRLQLQLENYSKVSKKCSDHEKIISKLQADKYKLEVQNQMLKKSLKDKDQTICKLKIDVQRIPKQTIKQVVIEKPVEVRIEVPKIIPGPQRIVQKIVQIPKYIEKKVVVHEPHQVVKTVEIPTVVQKPIYIDRPVYVDRPVQVQVERRVQVKVPVQIPVQVPVYVDRPVVQDDWLRRIQQLQAQVQCLLRENGSIRQQNQCLCMKIQCLDSNIEILRRHNQEKNRQVEMLLHNSMDYHPISPSADLSYGSAKYTVSSKPHQRMY